MQFTLPPPTLQVEMAFLTVNSPSSLTAWPLPATNPYFIPRSALTQRLVDSLPAKATGERSAKLVLAATSGMGGIGKTELARHLITSSALSAGYSQRFWFNPQNATTFRREFCDLACHLGLGKGHG